MKKVNIVLSVFAIMFLTALITLPGAHSSWWGGSDTSSAGITQKTPDKLPSSIEQENINKRLQIVNTASTTMWFYGLSDTGQIIFRSSVSGKVTSSGKRLEPVEGTNGNCPSHSSQGDCSPELIQADGTFGSSDAYVFWFDYEGNYYQWNGKYILSTKPLAIPAPVIEFQTIK